jgi:hypothetical protein
LDAPDLRKQYKQRNDEESGHPIILDGRTAIRTKGKVTYGWYVEGHPTKGWEGEEVKPKALPGSGS